MVHMWSSEDTSVEHSSSTFSGVLGIKLRSSSLVTSVFPPLSHLISLHNLSKLNIHIAVPIFSSKELKGIGHIMLCLKLSIKYCLGMRGDACLHSQYSRD